MALNNISIMGRITGDLELKHVGANGGTPTVSFAIACDRDFKNKETGERETDFFNCTAWRQTAEYITKYFSKGRAIVINGRLQRNDYEKDGIKHQNVVIVVDNAYFGDSKPAGDSAGRTQAAAQPQEQAAEVELSDFASGFAGNEDLPF